MSNQKDQAPNSPSRNSLIGGEFSCDLDSVAEESTDIPIKNRDFTETMPSYSIDDDILFSSMDKNEKLSILQEKAYFYVLRAFKAESLTTSSPRIIIVNELMKELNITLKTHTDFENAINADPMIQQLRNLSSGYDEKEMQKLTAAEERKITGVDGQPLKIRIKLNKDDMLKIRDRVLAPAKIQDGKVIAPANIQGEEAKPSSTSDDSPVPSWGQVSPGSLAGRSVNIRLPSDYESIQFHIKGYDEKTETHRLMSDFYKKDSEDPCNWIDLRHIPAEDTIWTEEHPVLPVRKCFLKPGETLLHETSTARNKKQLQEVGKTSSGIPIIRKVDNGKSVAKSPMQ